MVRHTLKTLQQMLQDFLLLSDHFKRVNFSFYLSRDLKLWLDIFHQTNDELEHVIDEINLTVY